MWLKRFIRRNTRKIPVQKAINWKQRLSVAYMLLTWNAFGMILYMCFTGRHDWMKAGGYVEKDVPPARGWAQTLGIKNAHVIKISGLNIEGTYDIKEDDENLDSTTNENENKIGEEDTELVNELE